MKRTLQTLILLTTVLLAGASRAAAPAPFTVDVTGKVFIKDVERCWFVAFDDIRLLESEGTRACAFRRTAAADAAQPEPAGRKA